MSFMFCALLQMNFASNAIFWILLGLAVVAVFVFF